MADVKPSIVTWQLRRLHKELDAIDTQAGATYAPVTDFPVQQQTGASDRASRRAHLDQLLRALPRRFGFRDAKSFVKAVERANKLLPTHRHRRLTPDQVRELEQRVLNNEKPADIAEAIGCAEQTVLNRATQLRRRVAAAAEQHASGI